MPFSSRLSPPWFSLLVSILTVLAGSFACAQAALPEGWPAGTESHFASFGTNRVRYYTIGKDKPVLVFVHCWAGRSEFWRLQAAALADRARLVLVDLPGHGDSDKPRVDYTMDFFARAVLAVMRDAKVEKATLIGHSMGVAVICSVAKTAPEKVTALVAVDGLMRRPQFTPEQADQFLGQFRGADYREQTTKFIQSMFPIAGTEKLRDSVLAEILKTPQYVMLGAMQGMFSTNNPRWDLAKVSSPIIVINTTNPLWTADYQAYIRSLSPKVEYHAITDAGHWLMLEKPAEFNTTLLEDLTKYDLIAKR